MIDKQFTSALRRAARTLTIALLAGGAACTSLTPTTRPGDDATALEQRALAAVAGGDLAAAVDLYTRLAAVTSGADRAEFLLEAARFAADYGDTALARRRIIEARNGVTAAQQQTSGVLLARLELIELRPQAALDLLAAIPAPLSESAQSDAAAVRGQALFQVGRPVEAVQVLAEREVWLRDGESLLANQRLIFAGFRGLGTTAALPSTGDTVIDGWLALAPFATSVGAELRRALLIWRQTYTSHPAAGGLLAELLAAQRGPGFPTQVALLLPLSAPQRAAALAVRDGFMAAHLRNPASTATAVRVYDSAQLGSAEAYLRAQLEGADFIVGPLLRPEVDQVIAQAGFVPTLALNLATTEPAFLSSFYQFALAPDDEARTIAATATAAGAKTAVVFVPSNPRGLQIRDSFQAAFEGAGGQVVAWSSYEPALRDFSQPIAALLNVTRSRDRHRRLAANLGASVQFEPRRRDDADMIFVAVENTRTGRLIGAQLGFFEAGSIPTYANADIFDPASTARDNDLNGFIFADTPALVVPDNEATILHAEFAEHWPQRAGLLRLYGMGYDAYKLIGSLYAEDGSSWPLRGLSGDLSLDERGRVRRVLPLAQFRNGRPVPFEVEGSAPPVDSSSFTGAR